MTGRRLKTNIYKMIRAIDISPKSITNIIYTIGIRASQKQLTQAQSEAQIQGIKLVTNNNIPYGEDLA